MNLRKQLLQGKKGLGRGKNPLPQRQQSIVPSLLAANNLFSYCGLNRCVESELAPKRGRAAPVSWRR